MTDNSLIQSCGFKDLIGNTYSNNKADAGKCIFKYYVTNCFCMKYRNLKSGFVIFSIPIYCLKDQANTNTKDSLVNFTGV